MRCPSCGAYMKGKNCVYCGYEEYVPDENTKKRSKSAGKSGFEKEYKSTSQIIINSIHSRRFDVSFRGYNIAEVDNFLDEIIKKINYHGNYVNINVDFDYNAINYVKFSQAFSGYDTRYVDTFLDKLVEDVRMLNGVKGKYR